MRTFKNVCAQGDIYITRVKSIPKNVVAVSPVDNKVIVTHSETGHHHVMVLDRDMTKDGTPSIEMFQSSDNPLLAWIKVNRPTSLDHNRPYDTHEPIMFDTGTYEIRRQREYTLAGWRQVAD